MIVLRRAVALIALALATAWCLPAAQGAETPGWYVGAEGGWSHLMDPTGTRTTPRTSLSFTTHPKEGFAAGADAGYAFRWGLRIEGEFVYRRHDLQSFTSSGGSTPAQGRIDNVAMMGNLLYDFSNRTRWTPYLGAGVGGARFHLEKFGAAAATSTLTAANIRLAYQGIAGVAFAITPALSLSLDYRYFATTNPVFSGISAGTPTTIKTDYRTHNVMLGLAYHFGAPPPPPPAPTAAPPAMPAAMVPLPAPPGAPVRQFTVYFDFDRSDLTAEGARVLQDAVATFRQTGAARIAVTGHTDLAGSQLYNMRLSKRRADTVRAALVRAGVPDGVISEAWRGKQQPAVQTPDGVREPRNRRVEIVL
jgi:OmpA-OmpF porin, OOP family